MATRRSRCRQAQLACQKWFLNERNLCYHKAAARNPDQLADLRSRYGDKIHTASLDVTSEAQAKDAVEAAVAKFGGLDVLVNNAGYGNVCPVENTPLDDFRTQIETNLFGVIIMTKVVLPYFRERGATVCFLPFMMRMVPSS
jgi:NAD(P)-dependent dehydrogenase (short-subunit alcohol dehydrogenase family)